MSALAIINQTRFERLFCTWIYKDMSTVKPIKSEPQLNPLKSIPFRGINAA